MMARWRGASGEKTNQTLRLLLDTEAPILMQNAPHFSVPMKDQQAGIPHCPQQARHNWEAVGSRCWSLPKQVTGEEEIGVATAATVTRRGLPKSWLLLALERARQEWLQRGKRQISSRRTRFSLSRNCTGAGPGGIWAGAATTGRLEDCVTLLMATTAEASRAAPEAVYTWPGFDSRVLFRLAAAAAATALPAVLGKVTSVFSKTVSTCNRHTLLGAKETTSSVWDMHYLEQRKQYSFSVRHTPLGAKETEPSVC